MSGFPFDDFFIDKRFRSAQSNAVAFAGNIHGTEIFDIPSQYGISRKSIIDAFGYFLLCYPTQFLLGGKSDAQMIRSGAHEASVSGTFLLGDGKNGRAKNDVPKVLQTSLLEEEDATAEAWLLEHGIESDDGRVLVRRTLRDSGKSSAWIQNTPVTRADLASFSALLVDIHGQHDHQSLMRVVQHRVFLDARAGITEDVRRFTALYAELVEKRKLLDELNASSEERERKIEMYSFALKEINEAKLKADEDVRLSEEEGRLSSYEKLASDIDAITNMLSDNETSAVSILKQVRRDAGLEIWLYG